MLKKLRPDGPYMSGEYWAGWFDHWGEHHHTTGVAANADEYEWMLRQGYSVSIVHVSRRDEFWIHERRQH